MKLFLNYTVKLGLFGSTNEPEEINTVINRLIGENQWRNIEYITGSLGYVANVLTEYDFEPEKEYDRCIIFWDGSEECNRVIQHCKQNDVPYWIHNKPINNNFLREIVVENYYKYKPNSNDYVVYIGRGKLPDIADYHGNCGNPFTVEQYGRTVAINKYVESKPDLSELAKHLKTINKRIVLLCWCKPQPCHGDYIREQLIKLGV